MSEMIPPYVPMDKMAKAYIKIRDRIAELTKQHDEAIALLQEQKDTIASAMVQELRKLGVESMRTREGTIVMSQRVRYYTNDWDEFKKFVMEHKALDLMEKRIAQRNMQQWLQEQPTLVPPGLSSDSTYDVSVRRPSA